jgi:hypothetical protein
MSKNMLIRRHDELVKAIPSFNIESYRTFKPWTDAITNFFHKLGKEKGYTSRSESGKKGFGEYMGLDMVWKQSDGNIILALEHENEGNIEKMFRTELSKLVDIKCPNKILICYPGNKEQLVIDEFKKKILANKYTKREHYLLMIGSQGVGKKDTDPFIRFESCIIRNDGNIVWTRDTETIPTK